MSHKFLEEDFKKGNQHLKVGLVLLLWQEDGIYYQYAPELDLTGYGKSADEANESFMFTLDEFISYTVNKKTLLKELEKLGWTTYKSKKKVRAPQELELLKHNEIYKNLIDLPGTHKSSTTVELPV